MVDRHVSGDRISAFLDDELDEAKALAVTRHLADCGHCLDELEALRRTRDALRRLPGVAAAPLVTIGAVARPHVVTQVSRRLRWTSLGVAATLAVLAALYVVGAEGGDVVPPTDVFLVDHLARTGGGPVPVPVGLTGR